MNNRPVILVVDDEKAIRNTLKEILEYEGYLIQLAESGEEALEIASSNSQDLILLDIKMQGMDGLECLEKLIDSGFSKPVIMISGHGTIDLAVQATKKGAFDFIQKPPDLNRLLISVRNALSQSELKTENHEIRKRLAAIPEILGESKEIQKVRNLIEKVCRTSSRVLITGDNGTGKELVARWIHAKSDRGLKPFVAVNCAAIPSELIESELFGYEKGAFTGADSSRPGKFELAHGGVLFLDEIGDMPLEAQSKVLRVLQEAKVQRLGSSETIDIDIQVISATNVDLEEAIQEKSFREDLYHRINVIPIHIPSLDERKEDITVLAQAFLSELKEKEIWLADLKIHEGALALLKERSWPGNVRELQNVIERLAVMSDDSTITESDVNSTITENSVKDVQDLTSSIELFHDFKAKAERLFLKRQLEKHNWNISKTAESIGLQRSHIYNKIKQLDIKR